ncbi:uncharacterized protein LOC110244804 [Exaiptasia diaphana]|uniref:Uncharacterized protein n=1 Tax=Exaiptasia diaphana TaxID=2652724 RepID=A0A913XMI7_EXADI|nr:uncharacterized protein LOC110244804 [Exaiptasia diaphana]
MGDRLGINLKNTTTTTEATTTEAATTPAGNVWVQVSTSKVCFGTKDDTFGTFTITKDGKIKKFKLYYAGGFGLVTELFGAAGRWGAPSVNALLINTKIETHITDAGNNRITPPVGYKIYNGWGQMSYDIPGYGYMSDYIILPEISPAISVKIGDQFRIWFGQDWQNINENNNKGQSCADVSAFYSEIA